MLAMDVRGGVGRQRVQARREAVLGRAQVGGGALLVELDAGGDQDLVAEDLRTVDPHGVAVLELGPDPVGRDVQQHDAGARQHLRADVRHPAGARRGRVQDRRDLPVDQGLRLAGVEVRTFDDDDVAFAQRGDITVATRELDRPDQPLGVWRQGCLAIPCDHRGPSFPVRAAHLCAGAACRAKDSVSARFRSTAPARAAPGRAPARRRTRPDLPAYGPARRRAQLPRPAPPSCW